MNERDRSRIRRAAAVYRFLLLLYPVGFRRDVGAMAIETFEDRYAEAMHRGRAAVFLLWIRTGLNVVLHGLLERWSAWRKGRPLEALLHHALFGTRLMRRDWKVSVGAIACIALGISATSSVLTLFGSVFIHPVPFPDADRLVRVWVDDDATRRGTRGEMSMLDFRDLAERNTTLEAIVATVRSRVMFLGGEGARRVEGEAVTRGYFDLVDASPALGRTFTEDEYDPASTPTMILAYGTWSRLYGEDPDIIGSVITTSLRQYTVIGVMPSSFQGTIEDDLDEIEFWIPVAHDRSPAVHNRRDVATAWTIGRVRRGVTIAHVNQDVTGISRFLARTYPDIWGPRSLRAEPYGENWRAGLRTQSYLLMTASFVLMIVAAANVAGLLVARSLGRRREFAVRAALGASRGKIVGQVAMETAVLTVVGAVLGVLVAPPVLRAFLTIAPDEIPGYVVVAPNPWALSASVAAIAFTGLIAGGLPALLMTRIKPAEALRSASRGNTSGPLERLSGQWIVGAEVALTTLMLLTASVLVRSYLNTKATDLGFRTDSILRMAVFVDQRDVASPDLLPSYYERLRETVVSYPGVLSVGLAYPTVPPGNAGETRIRFDNMPAETIEHGIAVGQHGVDPGFFEVLDIRITSGRTFSDADGPESAPVAIVSASLAELIGGDQVIGQTVETGIGTYQVVGVASDVKFFGAMTQRPRDYDLYTPLSQSPQFLVSLAIRTAGDPERFITPLRTRVAALTPSSPIDWVNAMNDELGDAFEASRFYIVLLTSFAASALSLTTVGLGALLAYQVARQRSELGIRRAIGAAQPRLFGWVVGNGMRIVVVGSLLGVLATVGAVQVLRSYVSGLERVDVLSVAMSVGLIAIITGISSFIPAYRASRVSPMEILRNE